MDTGWKLEYDKVQGLIKRKIEFLDKKEKEIDLSKNENYNKAIIRRIASEREFINNLIAFLYITEEKMKLYYSSNKHLEAQNTIYQKLLSGYEYELEENYGRSLKTISAE